MRRQNINIFICTLLCLLSFAACSTEDFFSPAGQEGNVLLVLPGVSTRVSGDDYSDNEEDGILLEYGGQSEGGVTPSLGLWFYAFPKDDKGTLYIKNLTDADLGTPDNKGHRLFNLSLTAGEYDFCIAANIPGLDKVYSAEDLKEKILQYPKESDLNNLKPGHLPMYRSRKITIEENKDQTVDMHMMFLCSKVLVKMKMAVGSTTTQKLKGLSLSHVATKSQVDKTLCEALNVEKFLGDGEGNAIDCNFTNNTDGVEITTEEKGYYTFYLPEYYNDGKNGTRTPTVLHFDIEDASGALTNYDLPLGGESFGSKNLSEVTGGNLERGTQYDITAILHDRGENWTLTVENFEWNTETMDAGFMQTTLWVSDTEKDSHVIPFVGGEFEYKSNAAVELECQEKINGKEIFIFNTEEGTDGKKKVTAMLNPDLSVKDFEGAGFSTGTAPDGTVSYEGTAHVILKANNLKKIIDFTFEKYEMFEVEPTHVTLREADPSDFYICRTNMGEVSIDYNSSNGYYDLKTETMPDGSIKITATGKKFDQKRTETFDLVVTKDGKEVKQETLSLTIIPSGKQVLHFTSINSHLKGESSSTLPFCAGFNGDFNPKYNIDYCTESPFNFKYPQTLVSDTETGTDVHYWKDPQIILSQGGSSEKSTNGRWTDFTLSNATNSKVTFTGGDNTVQYRFYKGFHSNDDDCVIANDTPIRYPYRDTKLQMFHFESQEGWIVADPTVVKVQFLDFEPKIVDVTYVVDVVNCDKQAYGMRWYLNYGQIFEGTKKVGRFLIQSEPATNGNYDYNVIKTYKVTNNHYRFVFTLKSVAHNTAKDINLTIRTQNGTIELGKLFAGEDYADRSMGTPDNMTVYGTYDVATEIWSKTIDKSTTSESYGTPVTTQLLALPNLDKPEDKFRIYFYMPMEPYSWQATQNVYLHLQGKGQAADGKVLYYGRWNKNDVKLTQYSKEPSLRRWWYIDVNVVPGFTKNDEGPYWNAQTDNGELIAVFFNDFQNSTDDISDDSVLSGFIYKSDCWAWATADNGYYPDFKVIYKREGKPAYFSPGNVIYYMDRKAFQTRPR